MPPRIKDPHRRSVQDQDQDPEEGMIRGRNPEY
jgi:hypothetical protein